LSSEKNKNNYALLKSVKTIYKPENNAIIENAITKLLEEKQLTPSDIDVVIYGINGDNRFDPVYYNLIDKYFKKSSAVYFKHLCGEYQTAAGFALWAAAKAIKTQNIPLAMFVHEQKHTTIKNILIYNTFLGTNHSVFLLSQC
jgi:3-oxoacyl-(acyl-carrier-protein) synthase